MNERHESSAGAHTPDVGESMKPRYIMIGGFLGAGKTTAVAQLAQRLTREGRRVGLITNDQGSDLVDTTMLRSRGFATEEIAGGCFCCRFSSLMEAANKLTTASRPDVFLAEPVGSCTDLVATVTYPLRRIYGNNFTIAPLSVLIDPHRAMRVLGLRDTGRKFSNKVLYIYRKQLEEADLLVINKSDLLTNAEMDELQAALQREYPHAEVFQIAARDGQGLDPWFERMISSEQRPRQSMELDYQIYGEGEALLGWLNGTVKWTAPEGVESTPVMEMLAKAVQDYLEQRGSEIAHLKMTLSPDTEFNDVAIINLVRNDYVPELSQRLDDPIDSGEVIVNLRAEADPEVLKQAVEAGLRAAMDSFPDLTLQLDHLEHFRPQMPSPTHRMEGGE